MATRTNVSQASTPELFAGALADVKEIAVGHLGHMKDEIGAELRELKIYLARTMLAVGMIVIAAVLFGETLAHVLAWALHIPMWAGYLLATAMAVVGAYLVHRKLPASKQNIDLVPEQALKALKRDVQDVGREAAIVTH